MNERRAALAAGITVVLWASAFVGIRAVAGTFSPGSIALGRLSVAVIALAPLLARQGWKPVARRDLGLIVASGLLWYALYFVVLNEAERHVDAGTAALLVNTGPIFIALFAGLFLGEGLPGRLILGIAVAFAGALVVGLSTSGDAGGPSAGVSLVGVGLCGVAALSYAAGVTLQKRPAATVPALQMTWIACLTGAVATLVFLPTLAAEAAAAPLQQTGWLIYLGLFPTALGFTTWAYALRRTTAGRLGATTYLVPPVVIVIAWLLLGELPPAPAILGGAICIAGVVIVRTPNLLQRRPLAVPVPEDA
ncbi:MAG TPA: DMT family transporter [Candidatus Limnocylindrales bacterium]